MVTWINFGWPFLVYKGQYEFRVSANQGTSEQYRKINSKLITGLDLSLCYDCCPTKEMDQFFFDTPLLPSQTLGFGKRSKL